MSKYEADLRQTTKAMAEEHQKSREGMSRYMEGHQWPESMPAPARWIGKEEFQERFGVNPSLTFVKIDGVSVSLETIRLAAGWPEDGQWNFDLARNAWRYQFTTGPETISITVGEAK